MPIPPMSPKLDSLRDFLQTHGPITLATIRKARMATVRGRDSPQVPYKNAAAELEVCLNFATFNLSGRIDRMERYLKNKGRVEAAPPGVMMEFIEILRELKLCTDIAHFAINQLTSQN